jgi:hypothetical protein
MNKMKETISICDEAGEITISYEDMLKYHGRDFHSGLVLSFKAMKLAFEKLLGPEVPHRDKIRLVVGWNPPGVIDGLEYITRAFTRQRLIVDPTPPKGPKAVFGRYYFEVHYEKRWVCLWIKEGIIPDEFTQLGGKTVAGIASPEEIARWKEYKKKIGHDLMTKPAVEIMDIEGPYKQTED